MRYCWMRSIAVYCGLLRALSGCGLILCFTCKKHSFTLENNARILDRVKNTQYTAGGTNTDTALKYATDTSFTAANGMRPNAAHIAIVITDGQSQNAAATAAEARRLRNKGITVFSIGVGGGAKQSELNAIATDPDSSHVFVVTDFDSLNQIKGTLQQKACDVKPTMAAATPTQKLCGGQADIVFLLDKSGSVGQANFDKMLQFVKNIANDFNIGPNDVQVGVDTYSTGFDHEFTLKQNNNKASLQSSVTSITYTGGGTNTGDAIRKMRQGSFTANAGHRANVPKIAIVVTDGQSNNKALTSSEAQKARDAGITMLAIGVGSGVDDAELNSIATDPDSQNVYKASTFDALTSLQGFIAAKACDELKPQPSANPSPNQVCGTKADIVFVLDSSGSVGPNNFKLLLNFVNAIVKDLDIGQNKIRVGVEKFSSRPYNEFNLNRFDNKTAMMNAISNISFQKGGTNTASAIKYMDNTMFKVKTNNTASVVKYMDNTMFKAGNGDRPGVPNIAIIITDGKSNRAGETKTAAKDARDHGINIFSVGVGNGISQAELKEMATDPDNTHVLTVTDFSKLNAIKAAFQAQTCQAIPPTLPPYVPTQAPAPTPGPDPCKDQIPNCAAYGQSVCTSYQAWSTTNCARTCGICTPSTPTVAPPCVDKLPDCPNYDASSCTGSYKPWAMENCRKYCGYCSPGTQTGGYFNKCFYKGTQYNQGDKWDDGCAYECECTDASTGQYSCYNKCPTYYNLPNKCTLVQQQGKCCLEPVCNFDGTYTTKTGQNVSDLNGNRVCVYNGRKYYQSQVWSVGCEFECICDDAGVGLYACQSKCAQYGSLPSNCKLVKKPGECCEKPDCEFQTQIGTFTGRGGSSGPGVNGMNTTPPPCVDKKADCNTYQSDLCTSQTYRPFALDNCRKFCNLCNQVGVPSPTDVCIYKGQAYKQGEAWYDGCDKVCVCDNAAFGFVRCDDRCPDYLNLPADCTLVTVPGQCCKSLNCKSRGTFTGSQTTPNTMGAVPQPYPVPQPGQYPTLPPGQTYAPGQNPSPTPVAYVTPAPGQTFAPGQNPNPTLAPGQVPSPSGGVVVVPPKLIIHAAMLSNLHFTDFSPIPSDLDHDFHLTLNPQDGCVYKGVLYQQGQRWADGCDSTCMCENGNTGKYRCTPKCPTFQNLDSRCTLKEDPNDPCCKYPECPTQPNGQIINVVPTYGQGFTGFSPAQSPTPTSGGNTGGLPVNVLPSGTSSPITGSTTGCFYKGVFHSEGSKWQDGCQYNCECVDGTTGYYRCTDICPNLGALPPQCVLIPDPNNACCQTYTCSSSLPTQAPNPNPSGQVTPPAGTAYCTYNGRYYRQGEEWEDGCSLKCRCEDATNDIHLCYNRCGGCSKLTVEVVAVIDCDADDNVLGADVASLVTVATAVVVGFDGVAFTVLFVDNDGVVGVGEALCLSLMLLLSLGIMLLVATNVPTIATPIFVADDTVSDKMKILECD
ncbi:LOW QUALITY PROTEIN: collagen alpha-5(vi) chain [Plakobranchus ocellatus]|uniref:Collagen alpha-5(Vi) chain n=1 Tax=Plakobranchus ocellatus TaxID=259542 RepID=A0AAV4BU98_9GAST|nr:LOW QUALITY PROTEIN: collagen alpha-5(vi) chain [Plakobranchus ocellatus]